MVGARSTQLFDDDVLPNEPIGGVRRAIELVVFVEPDVDCLALAIGPGRILPLRIAEHVAAHGETAERQALVLDFLGQQPLNEQPRGFLMLGAAGNDPGLAIGGRPIRAGMGEIGSDFAVPRPRPRCRVPLVMALSMEIDPFGVDSGG